MSNKKYKLTKDKE